MSERDALEKLFGPEVRFATARPGEVAVEELYPEEEAAVRRAVPKRRAELAAGRAAAREALAALGLAPRAIAVGPRGAPRWPQGVVGSITHTGDWALAAVARSPRLRGLGVDAEPAEPLEEELWDAITTEAEREALRSGAVDARRLFCAKEAAYKCQFPLTGTLLEFTDLEVAWAGLERFQARYTRPVGAFAAGDSIPGRIAWISGRWVAVARL